MKNSFFALNKKTLARNVMISLVLSASLIIAVINHATLFTLEKVGIASLFLTLAYLVLWGTVELRAHLKGRRGLLIWCRTWFVLGMLTCVFNAVATLASLTLSGFFAYLASFFVTVFAAPMYGFYLFGESTVGAMVAAFVFYFALCFVPSVAQYIIKRRRIKKLLK